MSQPEKCQIDGTSPMAEMAYFWHFHNYAAFNRPPVVLCMTARIVTNSTYCIFIRILNQDIFTIFRKTLNNHPKMSAL